MRGQCASQQIDRIRDVRIERRPEARDAFRHDDPVQPVLEVGVLVADMDRAVAVERDAGCLDQHLHEAAVDAARLILQYLAVDAIVARAQGRQDRVARFVEPPPRNDDVVRLAAAVGGRVLRLGRGRGIGRGGALRGGGLRTGDGGNERGAGGGQQEEIFHDHELRVFENGLAGRESIEMREAQLRPSRAPQAWRSGGARLCQAWERWRRANSSDDVTARHSAIGVGGTNVAEATGR